MMLIFPDLHQIIAAIKDSQPAPDIFQSDAFPFLNGKIGIIGISYRHDQGRWNYSCSLFQFLIHQCFHAPRI